MLDKPAQVSVIQNELMQIDKTLAELSEVVAILEGKLSPVMSEPEPVEPIRERTNEIKVQSAVSAVAAGLRSHRQFAESITSRLSSVLRRLEV